MPRLDIERQRKLEPERMAFAKQEIEKLGYTILLQTDSKIEFLYRGCLVYFFPYTGWHTGPSIKDGRGLQKFLNQIKP